MHIAAANPAALNEASLDPAVVEKEKQIQMDIARESGKPEAVIEKMIVGRMKKFMADSTLMGQAFVVNPDLTVEAAAKEAGVEVTGFVRLEVGGRHRESGGRFRRRSCEDNEGLTQPRPKVNKASLGTPFFICFFIRDNRAGRAKGGGAPDPGGSVLGLTDH